MVVSVAMACHGVLVDAAACHDDLVDVVVCHGCGMVFCGECYHGMVW